MTAVKTTINSIAIHRAGDSPIFGESTTIVRLDDDGGGPFIVIEQVTEALHSVVKLDPDELPAVMRAAFRLLRQESIDRDRGKGVAE